MTKYVPAKNNAVKSLGYVRFSYYDEKTDITQNAMIPCIVHSHSVFGDGKLWKLIVCPMGHNCCISVEPSDFLEAR